MGPIIREKRQQIAEKTNSKLNLKSQITPQEFGLIFDALFDEFLIETPPDFFDEDVGFNNDPEELTKIFLKLEEDNLTMIHNAQDEQQTLDSQKQEHEDLKKHYGREILQHENTLADLRQRIFINNLTLQKLQKQKETQGVKPAPVKPKTQQNSRKTGDKNMMIEEQKEVIIEDLALKMREQILYEYGGFINVYRKEYTGEIRTKSTLMLLNEMEIELFKLISTIKNIKEDPTQVKEITRLERERKQEFLKLQKMEQDLNTLKENENKKQQQSKMDKTKVRKIGRTQMI